MHSNASDQMHYKYHYFFTNSFSLKDKHGHFFSSKTVNRAIQHRRSLSFHSFLCIELLSVTGSPLCASSPTRSLERWAVEGVRAASSGSQAEPDTGPGMWEDPDSIVVLFPKPGLTLTSADSGV